MKYFDSDIRRDRILSNQKSKDWQNLITWVERTSIHIHYEKWNRGRGNRGAA
jgi:hypothetical protein